MSDTLYHLTEHQRRVYEAHLENPHMTQTDLAALLGLPSRHSVGKALARAREVVELVESVGIDNAARKMGLKANTIRHGWMKNEEGSFFFKADQEIAETANEQFIENIKEVFAEGYVPRAPVLHVNAGEPDENLLTKYIITDFHLGMKAWEEECGTEYNLEIAERNLAETMGMLIQSTPLSAKALIVNLGDYYHANDSKNMTPASGHILDVDGRYAQIAKVGIRAMRNAIYSALEKHDRVEYISVPGNHDIDQNFHLTIALSEHFHNNPRVTFKHIGKQWRVVQHGKNMLAFHHGHGIKFQSLALGMAAAEPVIWGATTYRYADTGHIHHKKEEEIGGVIIRSHRALGLPDAYAASHLYYSGQGMTASTYHKDKGEIQTNTVNFFKGRPV